MINSIIIDSGYYDIVYVHVDIGSHPDVIGSHYINYAGT